jgi:hypothetical protein
MIKAKIETTWDEFQIGVAELEVNRARVTTEYISKTKELEKVRRIAKARKTACTSNDPTFDSPFTNISLEYKRKTSHLGHLFVLQETQGSDVLIDMYFISKQFNIALTKVDAGAWRARSFGVQG